jgi:hypothetical protein
MNTRLRCTFCRHLTPRPASLASRPLVADLEALGLLSCPSCGQGSAWESWFKVVTLRASLASVECGQACQRATSTSCKCSCGGSAHGVA